MTTLWDTTGSEVVKALAATRRSAGAVASGLALTLVAVVEEQNVEEAEQAAAKAAAMHPCRLLLVVRQQLQATPRLDAEVQVGGRLGPGEAVVMRMFGRLSLHAESVVLPLLAPDAPVITWWHGHPPYRIAHDPLGVLADRRVSDCARADDPIAALANRAEDFAPGDTDLAWTRLTGWRSLLAATFDSASGRVRGGKVAAEPASASAALMAGWLSHRLGVPIDRTESTGPGITEVRIDLEGGASIWVQRGDGHNATVHRDGMPDRSMPLPRRELGELLGEELNRLDADEIYGDALGKTTGKRGLNRRDPDRTHKWLDPEDAKTAALEPALIASRAPQRSTKRKPAGS